MLTDKIMMLGSCFADSIAGKLSAGGFRICSNPFGTLYNPLSICKAVERLDSGKPFTGSDCVTMGAGAGLVCSFEHHTSFARATEEEFLHNANARLAEATDFWHSANVVIITLGTAFVWYHGGRPVANCLKRPAGEFERRLISTDEVAEALKSHILPPGEAFCADSLSNTPPRRRRTRQRPQQSLPPPRHRYAGCRVLPSLRDNDG